MGQHGPVHWFLEHLDDLAARLAENGSRKAVGSFSPNAFQASATTMIARS